MTTETTTQTGSATTPAPISDLFDIGKLTEDLRGETGLTKFKSQSDLARSYLNLEKLMGAGKDNLFRIPKDQNPEGMKEVFKHLGKPDKYEYPAELKVKLPDDYKA